MTKDIEGMSEPASPKDCALALYRGIAAGHYMITNELVGELLRCATRGVNPSNSFILDSITAILAQVKQENRKPHITRTSAHSQPLCFRLARGIYLCSVCRLHGEAHERRLIHPEAVSSIFFFFLLPLYLFCSNITLFALVKMSMFL